MGANISGDDFEANDNKEVFQSYRIPPKAYKKKVKDTNKTSANTSPKSSAIGAASAPKNGAQNNNEQPQQRYRTGSLSSPNKSRRDRPISHPPSFLSNYSSSSSLNLSIVNAAVAAGSPTPSLYPSGGLPMMLNGAGVGTGIPINGGVGSRTNSGYSIGSESFDLSHSVGSGLGRATYVNGQIVDMGFHGSNNQSPQTSGPIYSHGNYTVQDFISYQQQQQQQFLEQQQFEYQQMLLLQQQQQQLRQHYQQQQQLLLQQQQQLQQQHNASILSSQELILPQVTGVVLQTKSRRPARHPDRVSNGNGTASQNRNTSQSIAIPSAPTSPHHQQNAGRVQSSRSPSNPNSQSQYFSSSPTTSLGSNYTGAGSSFSSTGSQYQNMLAMTSTSPPSSSSSSLSTPGGDGGRNGNGHYDQYSHSQPSGAPAVSTMAATTSPKANKLGVSLDDLAAKILPPRRLLGGREYYPDKTLPYLLPCDEQEGE
ncbi:hypothetical protein BGZ49_004686, partial [Haplosporangium sp. Z 27]